MTPRIIATGSALPERIVTNDDLSRKMDTSDEWIRTRTGIRERRISEDDGKEKLLKLSVRAAEAAIAMAEADGAFSREEIGLVLVATCTPDMAFPAMACRLQDALSLPQVAAFDLSLACSGFLAALDTASAYIESGRCRTALVVGGDVMSRMLNWDDRNTAVLFGDGAGAVILSADERFIAACTGGNTAEEKSADEKAADAFRPRFALHSDGGGEAALYCKAMYFNENEPESEHMDGRKVFEFAVRKVPEVIGEVLRLAGTDAEDISLFVLHQANYRIIEAVAKRLKRPIEKFPHNIERCGNTTAGSMPILLDELNREGKLRRGDVLCLSGFGAGLSYGAAVLRW
ncbi:MAG: beta-ketoacyl-ACP synthase III [Eubacteriales bacterium]|nr:beta-ketoacyl-ACP synthase III [Eubacteriales bacterium]